MRIRRPTSQKMPEYSDYSNSAAGDFVTDGASEETQELTDQASADASSAGSTVDTSAIENAIEQATSDLADLQSDLASQKSIAEADSASLTEEEKEKMRVSNNLTELDAKSAKELVEEGKKGISADFNGVISKSAVQQGASATQGMELFTLQNTDKVSIDINVSKYDYDKVKEGQNADITIGDRKYTGKVTKISHIATNQRKGFHIDPCHSEHRQAGQGYFSGSRCEGKDLCRKGRGCGNASGRRGKYRQGWFLLLCAEGWCDHKTGCHYRNQFGGFC